MLYKRAFVVVCSDSFFSGLWALLSSIHAYHGCEYRVFVVAHYLSQTQLTQLRRHPLNPAITLIETVNFARIPPGTWEAKQMVLSELAGKVDNACLLDADLVLLSRMDDVFESSESGQIVSSQDGERPITYDEQYQPYGSRLVGTQMSYFNSGFLCLNLVRHWDLIALWEFTGRFAAYSPSGGAPYRFPGHGDQGLLNGCAALLGKQPELHLLPQSTWCNSAGWTAENTVDISGQNGPRLEVTNRRLQEPQRLLHSTGPKWWTTAGAEHFSKSGAVQTCFEYFRDLYPLPQLEADASQIVYAGDMRYIGDISLQDAQILSTRAGRSSRILEFGVGGSTQVLAQAAPPGATVTSVETDPAWIEITRANLLKLEISQQVKFLDYEAWLNYDAGLVDLVFVDGIDRLRPPFAERAWRFLRIGGAMLIHDTRRAGDASYALEFAKQHHLEIDSIEINLRASNITVITKKITEPYVNWNVVENL